MVIIKEARDSWYRKLLTKKEFSDFVAKSLTGQFKEDQKAWIGNVNSEAADRIKGICKQNVNRIMVSSSAIVHAYTKSSHNLLPTDILHTVDAINTADNIKISSKKAKQEPNAIVLEFEKDIGGNLTFVEMVKVSKKYNGWLDLVTCYRKRKVKGA